MATALATLSGVHASCSAQKTMCSIAQRVVCCGTLLVVMPEHVDTCVCKRSVWLSVASFNGEHANGSIHQVLYCLLQLRLKA